MPAKKSYFFQSFLIVLLAAAFFVLGKKYLPKKIFSEKSGTTQGVLIDSMLIEAFEAEKTAPDAEAGDSMASQPIVYYDTNGVRFPEETYDNYSGSQYLIPFFEKLYQLEATGSGNVRIAYFGDSMTDGDLIVQDIRAALQRQFGGKGVGFVAITSESAASRSSVVHQYSTNWKTQSYLNVKSPLRPFGVNGHVFFARDTSGPTWVKFKSGKGRFNGALYNPTLFYGNSHHQNATAHFIIGTDTLRRKMPVSSLLNTLVVKQGSIHALKADFIDADSIPVYGFNFDDGKGVHVDNFSQRGNSGIPISKFNVPLMKAFQEKLGYDLIVLHYGTNVLNYGTKDYRWYEKSMTRTVNRLRACFPGVAILVISTADKATKYELEMKTDSAVVPLVQAQKRYAISTQSGFVNLYTLMGGEGSMTKWTEEAPARANKDYTHFNFRGAKKVAGLLYEQIIKGYRQYKSLRKPEPVKAEVPADTVKKEEEDED